MPWDSDNLTAPHTQRELGAAPAFTWSDRCVDCFQGIGQTHMHWCPEDGAVTKLQTNGGRR